MDSCATPSLRDPTAAKNLLFEKGKGIHRAPGQRPDGDNEELPTQPFAASEGANSYPSPEKRFSRKGQRLTGPSVPEPHASPFGEASSKGRGKRGRKGATITQKTL